MIQQTVNKLSVAGFGYFYFEINFFKKGKEFPDTIPHLLSSPVPYPPSFSHSPSLSLFHPLFFPLWVCSLWTTKDIVSLSMIYLTQKKGYFITQKSIIPGSQMYIKTKLSSLVLYHFKRII